MAADLGATFSRFAMEPLLTAYAQMSTGGVREGIATLDPGRLRVALQSGVAAAARRAGVRRSRVEKLVPSAEVDATLERIRKSQGTALEVWGQHRSQLGGFLAGVAEVTAESEKEDVGWFLSRLAGKVVRDRALAGPLDDLAADVTRWEQLVVRCTTACDSGGGLTAAYRWRWVRAVLAVLVVLAAIAIAAGLWLRQRASRGRVQAALGAAEPCAAEGIAPADLERALPEQRAAREVRLAACAEGRARAAYLSGCDALATNVDAGRLTAEDAARKARPDGVLGRIAKGELVLGDVMEDLELPCADTAAAPRLESAYLKSAAASAAVWAVARAMGPKLRAHRAAGRFALGEPAQRALAEHAEAVANHAVLQGAPASIEEGRDLCALEDALGVPRGKWCTALAAALASKK